MARNTVKKSYGKAEKTPSKRVGPKSTYKMPMNKPQPRSDQLEYVETHRQDGDLTIDLVQEFQLVCKHERQHKVIAHTPEKKFLQCPDCKRIKVGK